MKVELVASTTLESDVLGDTLIEDLGMYLDEDATDPESLIEYAGRGCYKSYHKPNEKTRENKNYVANIIRQKHLSVLEHSSVSFYVEGVSRSLTHELIRHRHLSFSQESQRFVRYGDDTQPVFHPAYRDDPIAQELLLQVWRTAVTNYKTLYNHFIEKGKTRKQSAEAAREVLPNACPTSLVVSGNLRAWYEYLPKRYDPNADAQIQEFSEKILGHLRYVAPSVFGGFGE